MSTDVAAMIDGMKPLPRRRVAHLRALIRQPSLGALRRAELASLLRAELTAPAPEGGREP
jgi:hypothetical protein